MAWTDDRVEKLKTMWTEGNSASQIAKELGGVTRNAVIGKVHRLGLSNRASSTKPIRDKASVRSAPKSRSKPSSPRIKTIIDTHIPEKNAIIPMRKPILTPGQPLPPQPSANEISPEALATVKEVEKGINSYEAIKQIVVVGSKDTSYGPQIMSLGGVEAVGNTYWALYVNGLMSMVGAHDVILSEDTFIRLNMEAF